MQPNKLNTLKTEVESELCLNILPFWMSKMIDSENGGFVGRIDGTGQVYPGADKGCVLNARILWTFSSAYRVLKNPDYLKTAERSKDYLLKYFFDKKNGGVFWLLDYEGNMKDGKKQIYAQAFAIYALVEYYRISKDTTCLNNAIDLFRLIEKYSFDDKLDGYFEAFSIEWGIIDDLRLSAKDANEKKTMNTHLHVLEAYTNLYRVWKDDFLKKQLGSLLRVFTGKIVNSQTFNLNMFFDENWNDKTDLISYGHNIEASWLLYEAALILGDELLIQDVRGISLRIADVSKEGVMPDGSMIYEKFFQPRHIDFDRHWWVQAESVVGFLIAFSLSGKEEYLDMGLAAWKFISAHLVDRKNGEWYWSVDNDLQPNLREDKAGFWKCPYHNSRMCLEIIERYNFA
ncbi:MAG: AGE family epimerase/isomerase [Bacteroidia bacterium]|nr:AGE family epimerase/isomerase [Bacteroidia bacterium]